MWLLLVFIIVPLIEIGLFITVGGWLTLWPTLAIVIATGVIGTFLVRWQGLKVLEELRGSMTQMRDPVSPLAHGALILLAGILLLTPGFFTDAIGFLLLVPAVRRMIIAHVASRVTIFSPTAQPRSPYREDSVIDGEFSEITPDQPVNNPENKRPSGWTKH
ncbi:FxsA family protein [Pseudorhodobacter sp.]|uniref:FxsA family protein n=1 Tax=Pseudorhodobacter sp. TaxID=1934400 RepID=UPI00264A3319|nr:FxsA family protein [Pseudorhodobacter sp.]MDN5787640.1 FxsA family protein [Pseudorhodobacter sp.]